MLELLLEQPTKTRYGSPKDTVITEAIEWCIKEFNIPKKTIPVFTDVMTEHIKKTYNRLACCNIRQKVMRKILSQCGLEDIDVKQTFSIIINKNRLRAWK